MKGTTRDDLAAVQVQATRRIVLRWACVYLCDSDCASHIIFLWQWVSQASSDWHSLMLFCFVSCWCRLTQVRFILSSSHSRLVAFSSCFIVSVSVHFAFCSYAQVSFEKVRKKEGERARENRTVK